VAVIELDEGHPGRRAQARTVTTSPDLVETVGVGTRVRMPPD
jgi:hypothetical protein